MRPRQWPKPCIRETWIQTTKCKARVPLAVVQQHMLEHRAAVLSIEKSEMELRIAGLQAKVSEAELAQATEKVERRRIKSPLAGQVQKIYRHVGEWVQAGEPVLHVVQVSTFAGRREL